MQEPILRQKLKSSKHNNDYVYLVIEVEIYGGNLFVCYYRCNRTLSIKKWADVLMKMPTVIVNFDYFSKCVTEYRCGYVSLPELLESKRLALSHNPLFLHL